jgi:hypothetical protein
MEESLVAIGLIELLSTRGRPERSRRIYRRHSRRYPEEAAESRRLYWMCVYRDGGEIERFDRAGIKATINWLQHHSDPTARRVGDALRDYGKELPPGWQPGFASNVEIVLEDGGRIAAEWVHIVAESDGGESASGVLILNETLRFRERLFPRFTMVNVDLVPSDGLLNCTTDRAVPSRDGLFVSFTIESSRGVP